MSAHAKWVAALLVPFFVIVALAVMGAQHEQVPLRHLTRDIASVAHVHPLTGLLSSIGILLWSWTAAICIFCAALLRPQGSSQATRLLLWAGLFSLFLLFDDLFMFHEALAQYYLGISQTSVLTAYPVVGVLYLARCRRTILQTEWRLLALGLATLSAALAVDQWYADSHDWCDFVEDCLKLLGIVCWFGYHSWTAFQSALPLSARKGP